MTIAITARLKALYESAYKNKRTMALTAGVKEMTLNNAIEKGSDTRYSFLEAILKANPNVSAEWLMRGEGEMFRDAGKQEGATGDNIIDASKSNNKGAIITNGAVTTGTNDELYEALRQENTSLKDQLRAKDSQISMLLELMKK